MCIHFSHLLAMKRFAFTLVELLVVVAVIALLAAILLVAVNGARETARRNQCLTRQRDLALAMVTYNVDNNGLPGSLNQFGSTPIHSWAVAIFPMIGENKRYEFLTKDQNSLVPNEVAQAVVSPPALLCPSDELQGIARLNYFVNCGPADYSTNNVSNLNLDYVLFRDRRTDSSLGLTALNTKVKLDEIPDGTSNTILLLEDSEGTTPGRGTWYVPDWSIAMYVPNEYKVNSTSTRSGQVDNHLGFTWGSTSARPLTKHVGTGNVAFADGSARPINDDISIWEFLRNLCPDDAQGKKAVNDGGLGLTNL